MAILFVNKTGRELFIHNKVIDTYTSFKVDESRYCKPEFACHNGQVGKILDHSIKFCLKNSTTYYIVTAEIAKAAIEKDLSGNLFIPEDVQPLSDKSQLICSSVISV